MSRFLRCLCLLLVPVIFAKAGNARPQDDSTVTGSRYEVGVGAAPLNTAHAPMVGLGAAYTWNGTRLHFKVHYSYRRTLSVRGGVAENDTRSALMIGLHQKVRGRRVALSTGVGSVFGGRYSGILVIGKIPLLARFIDLGVPIEVNATLFQLESASLALSVFGFVHVISGMGEQKGSALGVSVTTRFGNLF